ncbi:MAG TPA: tRNA (adenosine(37)-N6)-threonylcarbamoyltransferase complex transferase subunit TsaD [Patescibacteria group bacterium]|nr:tRNA (adenosine(37)-N6)-threonylcarbamoyltransferase complex transferase subunit TsaD [Patescibacteria group bacterium]
MPQPLILAIDTSCDETAVAVSSGRKILSNAIASQINIHKKYGGVVPHLAKRAHQEKIEFVYREALSRAGKSQSAINALAVTIGPGLAPALEVGIDFAKNLSRKLKRPLIAVNHMEGHLLSCLANNDLMPKNALGLLVSGGHTELVLVKTVGSYQLLGQTLDDAAGEALDKLSKMLKLGYPGGPIIEELSTSGDANAISLPIPMRQSGDLNFSFSGLKTAALNIINSSSLTKKFTSDMAASFQKAVAISLTTKLSKAIAMYQPKAILLGGGVISNLYIRRQIRQAVKPFNLPIYLPYSKKLYTDNAAMIAIPAYFKFLKKEFVTNLSALDRQPSLSL